MIFRLCRSDIIAFWQQCYCNLIVSVLFYSPPKLAKRISLGVSRITLRSNRTRLWRIKLRDFLMRSLVRHPIFYSIESFSSRFTVASFISTYVVEARGTLISIPIGPAIAPPTVTAASIHIPGKFTLLPITRG